MTKVIVLLSTVILLGCGAEASEDQVGETATLVINIGQFEKEELVSKVIDIEPEYDEYLTDIFLSEEELGEIRYDDEGNEYMLEMEIRRKVNE